VSQAGAHSSVPPAPIGAIGAFDSPLHRHDDHITLDGEPMTYPSCVDPASS